MNSFDFRKSLGANGKESRAQQTHIIVKDRPQTLPSDKQVLGAVYDPDTTQRFSKSPKSLLYLQFNKDPIEIENTSHRPSRMSIESHTSFVKHPAKNNDSHLLSIGPKTGSGFTHSINNEPITFRNECCYDGNQPSPQCHATTGLSFTRSAFQPLLSANGKEECKLLSQRAATENGYTRSMKPRAEYTFHRPYTKVDSLQPFQVKKLKNNNKGDYFDVLYSSPFPSMTTASFPRHQHRQQSDNKDGSQAAASVGPKQDTGFTKNNCKLVQNAETDAPLDRFDTHYKLRFYDRNPKLINDAFLGCRNVFDQKENGFVKSTRLQTMGGKQKPTGPVRGGDGGRQISTMHQYVARSLRARDPTYSARCNN